jgi:hypothetical protein
MEVAPHINLLVMEWKASDENRGKNYSAYAAGD